MNWFMQVMRKYNDFSGRARRKEYWMFSLIAGLGTFVLSMMGQFSIVFSIITLVYSLVILWPSIGVGVRRLHDTGRSGWMLLLALIPVLGALLD